MSGTALRRTLAEAAGEDVLSAVSVVVRCVEHADDRGDPEHLHRLRVSLRRLRACLRAYKDLFPAGDYPAVSADVAAFFRVTSPLRDIDVQTARLAPLLDAAPRQARPGISGLIDEMAGDEKNAALAVAAAASEFTAADVPRRIARLALEVERTGPSTAARDHAAADVRRALRPVRRVAGPGPLLDLPADSLHELRIDVKKLRYTAEPARRDIDDTGFDAAVRRLAAFQDVLGDLHDADFLATRLEIALAAANGADPATPGLLFLAGDAHARSVACLKNLGTCWTTPVLRRLWSRLSIRTSRGGPR